MDKESPIRKTRSFKEQVQVRILDHVNGATGELQTSEAHFRAWLAHEGWEVRDQSVARTALSTFIEWRTFADRGVYIKGDSLFIGSRVGSQPYEFELPYWMVVYITSFPKAPWAHRAEKLAKAAHRERA